MQITIILPIDSEVIFSKDYDDYDRLAQVLGEFGLVSFLAHDHSQADHVTMTVYDPVGLNISKYTEELHALYDMRRHLKYGGSYTFLPTGGNYVKIRLDDSDC